MSSDIFGTISVAFLALAIGLAAVAVVLFFVFHIRQVRDDLTGQTAQRAIADLRSGNTVRSRFFGGESHISGKSRSREAAAFDQGSGSLHIRNVGKSEVSVEAPEAEDLGPVTMGRMVWASEDKQPLADSSDEMGTTLLMTNTSRMGQKSDDDMDEMGTTLLTGVSMNSQPEIDLRDNSNADDEMGTTLLSPASAMKAEQLHGSDDDADAIGTTLLSSIGNRVEKGSSEAAASDDDDYDESEDFDDALDSADDDDYDDMGTTLLGTTSATGDEGR
ncbi:MAG: hypothetical protein ACOYIK_05565 [Coriobacteriales bacterium]|jgi:hypothetical protein